MAFSSTTERPPSAAVRRLICAAAVALAAGVGGGGAAAAEAGEALRIGYLEIAEDPPYEQRRAYAGIQLRPQGRPVAGAELAIRESRIIGRALKLDISLERASGARAVDLVSEIARLEADRGVRFFLIDAAAAVLDEVAESTRGRDMLLFNVSESADALRGEWRRAHVMHVIPSRAMLTDALVQYLIAKRWRDVLVLKGPLAEDAALARAFGNSARRFGARIVATRESVLSNDPRERDKNNIALMTSVDDHDVVFLADTDGEFGRYVPYQTSRPRPSSAPGA